MIFDFPCLTLTDLLYRYRLNVFPVKCTVYCISVHVYSYLTLYGICQYLILFTQILPPMTLCVPLFSVCDLFRDLTSHLEDYQTVLMAKKLNASPLLITHTSPHVINIIFHLPALNIARTRHRPFILKFTACLPSRLI